MKKILIVFLLLLMCFSINITFADVGDIEIEAAVGLEGKIKPGKYIPVEVKLTNNGENIKGKLKLLIPLNGESVMEITKDIEIPKGTTKIINTGFYYDDNNLVVGNSITVELLSGKKNIKIKKTFSKILYSNLIVGLLTNDEKIKTIVNKTSTQNGQERINLYAVDLTSNFPNRLKDLDLCDVIVISEFNKDILSASELKVYNKMLKVKKIINLDELDFKKSKYEILEIKLEQEIRFLFSNSNKTNNFWRINQFIGSVPKDRLPSLGFILFIVISFVILVGPVNFIILKIKDKTHLTWFTMTGIAVLYVFIIFIIGKTTTLNNKLINEFSVINLKDNFIEKTSYLGINGGNNVVKIDLDTEGYLYPYKDQYSYRSNINKDVLYEVVESDNHISLEYFKSSSFKFNFANIYENKVSDNSNNFIVIKGDSVILNYENNLDFKIKNAILIVGDKYKYMGDLKEGNTKIEYSLKKDFSQYYGNDLYQLADIDDSVKNKYNVLLQEITSSVMTKTNIYTIIGWSDESNLKDIKINNSKADVVSTTLLIMDLDVKYELNGETILKKGNRLPTIYNTDTNYSLESGVYYTYNNGFITFEFDTIDKYYTSEMNIDISNTYSNDIEIFNGSTNEFEAYKNDDNFIRNIKLDKNDFEKYKTKNNSILIKFNLKENASFEVPKYSLKGGVK